MALLSDNTVTDSGDIDGYNPAPLTLYAICTGFGNARTHDADPLGRWFDIGWWAPYFTIDPVGAGAEHYTFDSTFIQFEWSGFSLHQFTGGIDGFHYSLGPGVTVRFILTDD
jgi:hypothetical protein